MYSSTRNYVVHAANIGTQYFFRWVAQFICMVFVTLGIVKTLITREFG